MNPWFRFIEYLIYKWHGRGRHGIHSPFVFEFIEKILHDNRLFYCYDEMEKLRAELKSSDEKIEVNDFGATSIKKASYSKSIRSIAIGSAKSPRLAQLLFRIAEYYRCKTILELGTSLGISTLYLSSASNSSAIITLEGSESIAAIAKKNFDILQKKNIKLNVGAFGTTLLPALKELQQVDLAFIDGNHRYEPTLSYFETILLFTHNDSILVFDDIYWSPEMKRAWVQIKNDKRISLTIDLYYMGIIFLKKELSKENFVLKF